MFLRGGIFLFPGWQLSCNRDEMACGWELGRKSKNVLMCDYINVVILMHYVF